MVINPIPSALHTPVIPGDLAVFSYYGGPVGRRRWSGCFDIVSFTVWPLFLALLVLLGVPEQPNSQKQEDEEGEGHHD